MRKRVVIELTDSYWKGTGMGKPWYHWNRLAPMWQRYREAKTPYLYARNPEKIRWKSDEEEENNS